MTKAEFVGKIAEKSGIRELGELGSGLAMPHLQYIMGCNSLQGETIARKC